MSRLAWSHNNKLVCRDRTLLGRSLSTKSFGTWTADYGRAFWSLYQLSTVKGYRVVNPGVNRTYGTAWVVTQTCQGTPGSSQIFRTLPWACCSLHITNNEFTYGFQHVSGAACLGRRRRRQQQQYGVSMVDGMRTKKTCEQLNESTPDALLKIDSVHYHLSTNLRYLGYFCYCR